MHWNPRHGTKVSSERLPPNHDGAPPTAQGHDSVRDVDNTDEDRLDYPVGFDDAADARSRMTHCTPPPAITLTATNFPDEDSISDTEEDELSQIPMPLNSSGVTTLAYQRALLNRIKYHMLDPGGSLDMCNYKPTFLHDCLMLPGSLANLLDTTPRIHGQRDVGMSSGSSADPQRQDPIALRRRMTPALLSGFHAYVHADTLQPCILQSPNAQDHVQGIVIFGLGRHSRRIIHQHYRSNARRVKVEVEIEVERPVKREDRDYEDERWRLQRRKIWAHAWLHANAGSGDVMFRSQAPRWSIEQYLSGDLDPDRRPNVVEMWPDAEVDVEEVEREKKPEPMREVVYGGAGSLQYERQDYDTGW